MGNRTIQRSVARKLYGEFSRKWTLEKRLHGKAGKPGFRKPTFHQWHELHERNYEMMAESTPSDVQEFLGGDPWESPSERGVMTIPIHDNEE